MHKLCSKYDQWFEPIFLKFMKENNITQPEEKIKFRWEFCKENLTKKEEKKIKKCIKFIQKDIAKGFDIPKKVLFGKEKNLRKYDKKLTKKYKK